jgi:hypothetical protein
MEVGPQRSEWTMPGLATPFEVPGSSWGVDTSSRRLTDVLIQTRRNILKMVPRRKAKVHGTRPAVQEHARVASATVTHRISTYLGTLDIHT